MVPRKSWISEIFDPISKSRKLLWRVTKSRFSCVSFGLGVSNFFRKVSESRICFFSRDSQAKVIALSEQSQFSVAEILAFSTSSPGVPFVMRWKYRDPWPGSKTFRFSMAVWTQYIETRTNQICQTLLLACAEWREVSESRTSGVGPGQRSRSPVLTKRIAASGNEIVAFTEAFHSARAHAHLIRFPMTITTRTLWCWNRTKAWSVGSNFSWLSQRTQLTRFRFYK